MSRLTVKDLQDLKGRRQLVEVNVTTPAEARACEAAGIDMIITSERNDGPAIRDAAPDTFLTIGLTYGEHPTAADAVRGGFAALRAGADAVYAGVAMRSVQAMADEGIPVVGHVGFIPYKKTWFGGYKAVGKSAEDAIRVYERTLAYEKAGAIGVEMEIVPYQIAAEITRRVRITVLSMGSGSGCDGQYLYATDLLGTNTGHVPRHAKAYRDFKVEYERLYQESVAAFREFKTDIDGGRYPAAANAIEIDPREYRDFVARLGR